MSVRTETHPAPHGAGSPANRKAIVLYDGNCPLCQRGVRILKRLDWLKQLHCQDCNDTVNFPKCNVALEPKRLLEEMHLVTSDRKRAYAGFAAFRWMAWRMPPTFWCAPLLYLPGIPWLGRKAYLWVARNRYDLVPCGDGGCQVRLPVKKSEDRGQRTAGSG